jgi:hypothetical protein
MEDDVHDPGSSCTMAELYMSAKRDNYDDLGKLFVKPGKVTGMDAKGDSGSAELREGPRRQGTTSRGRMGWLRFADERIL